jgi:serine/threonine protein kinase
MFSKTVDWWAVGVVMYELLTGYPPFSGKNVEEVFHSILNDEVDMSWTEVCMCFFILFFL